MATLIYMEKNNISLLVEKSNVKRISELSNEGYNVVTKNNKAVEITQQELVNGSNSTGNSEIDSLLGINTKVTKGKAGLK